MKPDFVSNGCKKGRASMSKDKPVILIVGTFHMGSTPDLIQTEVDDILLSERQLEIQHVVEKLKAFQPNKIAVEVDRKNHVELNKAYQQYADRSFQLPINEVYQIGFRLNAAMSNKEIYPVDWMGDIGQRDIGDVLEWAKTEQPELFKLITEVYLPKIELNTTGLTMLEILQICNDQERVKIDHQLYMHIARIGKERDFIGIDWVRWWYQRNLSIYANLTKLVHDQEDRILLLIGAGHIHLISQFLNESGLFDVKFAANYLSS